MGYGSALEKRRVNSDCLVSSNLTLSARILTKGSLASTGLQQTRVVLTDFSGRLPL
jgi:hypothetical protein